MSWYNEETNSSVVLSTRARLARNIAKLPFPHGISNEDAVATIEKIKNILPQYKFYKLSEMSKFEILSFVEKHYISNELISSPNGAVFLSEDEKISIMVMEEDHIRIQVIEPGFEPDKALEKAIEVDKQLAKKLEFAFHEKFGYLTACPTNAGTGLRISAMLHLPSLTTAGAMAGILNSCGKLGMTIRGIYGEGSQAEGNNYQISNQTTLGVTEEEIKEKFVAVVNQIRSTEKDAAKTMFKENETYLRNKIMRSEAVLKHSYSITSKEMMNLLSDVRIGLFLGVVEDIKACQLNSIMITMQPATMQLISGGQDSEERDITRARMIAKILE